MSVPPPPLNLRDYGGVLPRPSLKPVGGNRAVCQAVDYGGVLPRPSLKVEERVEDGRPVEDYGGVLPRPSLKGRSAGYSVVLRSITAGFFPAPH